MIRSVQIDWSDCDVVERVPGRCGGRPTIKGTRIEPDGLITDYEMGSSIEEIHENFPTVPFMPSKDWWHMPVRTSRRRD